MGWVVHLRELLPNKLDWAPVRTTWRVDLVAGITVGIVALPLALAFGVSSGVGAAAGLVTAIIAGAVAAIFGGSNVQVSGPTGAMVVILAPIVAQYGAGAVALLSLMAGFLVLLLGLFRLGRAVSLIPWPVVEGFTLGIGVIIFLQQVPMAVGTSVVPGHNTFVAATEAIRAATWPTALITLAVVVGVAAVVLLAPKLHRALPGSLIGVIVATIVVELVGADIPRIGELPNSLPAPSIPYVDLSLITTLSGAAFAVALLAAIESLLSARVAAGMASTGSYHPDRELVGQGLASMASGLFGGMPATGAIARTAVNVRSGARTRLSAVVHAVVLLAVVYLAATLVSRIPLAALAGVLMVTATRMMSVKTARSILTSTRSDAVVFAATAIVTVAFDLIQAILIGVLAAAFFALRTLAGASGVIREQIPGEPVDGDEHIAVFRLDGAMFFGAAERVINEVDRVHSVQVVILRLSHLNILDASGAHALAEIVERLEARQITVLLKGLQDKHVRLVTNVGVLEALRHEKHLFAEMDDAVEHARSHVRRAVSAGTISAPGQDPSLEQAPGTEPTAQSTQLPNP